MSTLFDAAVEAVALWRRLDDEALSAEEVHEVGERFEAAMERVAASTGDGTEAMQTALSYCQDGDAAAAAHVLHSALAKLERRAL